MKIQTGAHLCLLFFSLSLSLVPALPKEYENIHRVSPPMTLSLKHAHFSWSPKNEAIEERKLRQVWKWLWWTVWGCVVGTYSLALYAMCLTSPRLCVCVYVCYEHFSLAKSSNKIMLSLRSILYFETTHTHICLCLPPPPQVSPEALNGPLCSFITMWLVMWYQMHVCRN